MIEPNIYQVASEVDQLLDLLRDNPPRRVLEIGVSQGGTIREWSKVAASGAMLIGIDPNPVEITVQPTQSFHMLKGDSHSIDIMQQVDNLIHGEKLDFLFIDGDHSYESVRNDFETYYPMVREAGIVALHDIVPGPPENVGGVPEYWRELKKRYRTVEFVQDWKQGGYGIGIIVSHGTFK